VKSATPLSVSLFANRLLLIIFGGDHWVYGYILIYLIYGLLLTTIIARKHFPLEDDTVTKFDPVTFAPIKPPVERNLSELEADALSQFQWLERVPRV
jgi:hypothetical protein